MRVKSRQLKFEVDSRWPKRTWIQRLAARIVAAMFINQPSKAYQTFSIKCKGEWVDGDKWDYIHWILREAGYSVCIADIWARIGYNEKDRLGYRELIK